MHMILRPADRHWHDPAIPRHTAHIRPKPILNPRRNRLSTTLGRKHTVKQRRRIGMRHNARDTTAPLRWSGVRLLGIRNQLRPHYAWKAAHFSALGCPLFASGPG